MRSRRLRRAACRLPKLDRGTGRAVGIERRWSAMSLVLALLGAARATLSTHTNLALENLALRQQLALLRHRSKRPRFGRLDRAFWVWLSRRWAGWRPTRFAAAASPRSVQDRPHVGPSLARIEFWPTTGGEARQRAALRLFV